MEKYTEGSIVISSKRLGNALHICYHMKSKNMQTPEIFLYQKFQKYLELHQFSGS